MLTNPKGYVNISESSGGRPAAKRKRSGRVVELVDSLDSGSSVHYGRAGSSPASRTKRRDTRLGISSFLLWGCEEPASYTGLPPQTSEAFVVGKGRAAKRVSLAGNGKAHDTQLARTPRLAHQKETVERLFLFLYSGDMEHLLFSPHTFKRDILSDVSFLLFPVFAKHDIYCSLFSITA